MFLLDLDVESKGLKGFGDGLRNGHYLRGFFYNFLLDGLTLIVGCEFVAPSSQKHAFVVLGPYY